MPASDGLPAWGPVLYSDVRSSPIHYKTCQLQHRNCYYGQCLDAGFKGLIAIISHSLLGGTIIK